MDKINEKDYECIFEIIMHAGEARSLANESINYSENYEFIEAENMLEKAKNELVVCHNLQTDLLNKEAGGDKNDVNIFLIHAQDHFTMASTSIEFAERFKRIYLKFKKMEDIK
ncbi:PTS lactose/cellobiose transporter subunit IIA [Anaerococcus porci]|uniref:PTS lactose/cellobiose transporter subunit IIA n=1 Tax=Anaerococcus porci TaxID=2652269 RepID=UPI002A758085|nr:PTS lactose/cellobiose transporter subunit IIA [Anaerococcus porci]MDY3005742.1 PTS lactose/cellobiose transporter subunit IIA [Anaerococcus porci]